MYPCPRCHEEMDVMDASLVEDYGNDLYGLHAILACIDCSGAPEYGDDCYDPDEDWEDEEEDYDDDGDEDDDNFQYPPYGVF